MHEKNFPILDLTHTGANIVTFWKIVGLTVQGIQMIFGFNSPQAIADKEKGLFRKEMFKIYDLKSFDFPEMAWLGRLADHRLFF